MDEIMNTEIFERVTELIFKKSYEKSLCPTFVTFEIETDSILVGFNTDDDITEEDFLMFEKLFYTFPVELVRMKQEGDRHIVGTFKYNLLSNKPL